MATTMRTEACRRGAGVHSWNEKNILTIRIPDSYDRRGFPSTKGIGSGPAATREVSMGSVHRALGAPVLALVIGLVVIPAGNLGAQTVFVRRDVSTLSAAQIAALRRGVSVMKSRPA